MSDYNPEHDHMRLGWAVAFFEQLKECESFAEANERIEQISCVEARAVIKHLILGFKQEQAKHGVISWDACSRWSNVA